MPHDLDAQVDEGAPPYGRAPSSPSNSWSSGETATLQGDSPLLGDDGGRRPKRCKISREQLSVLINSFEEEPLPNFDQRQALAKMLGMTPRSVQIWFQNRRQRLKPMQSKSSSPGLSHGGMQQRFGSKHGQTPQQQLGMPGLTAAAGLCSGTGTGGGQAFEQLMLHSAMSHLTSACAGARSQLNNACVPPSDQAGSPSDQNQVHNCPPSADGQPVGAPSGGGGGGYGMPGSYGDVMEPFAATKALLYSGYNAGSSTSLACAPNMPQVADLSALPTLSSASNHSCSDGSSSGTQGSPLAGMPHNSSLITPSTAQVMGGIGHGDSKREKADGLLLLLACADNNAQAV